MSKALSAVCQHLKDLREDNYPLAFKYATLMIENWWHMGRHLRTIEKHKGNALPQGSAQGVLISDLGINYNQSARCQRLAEMEQDELHEWIEGERDEAKYTLPSLRPAASRARQTRSNEPAGATGLQ